MGWILDLAHNLKKRASAGCHSAMCSYGKHCWDCIVKRRRSLIRTARSRAMVKSYTEYMKGAKGMNKLLFLASALFPILLSTPLTYTNAQSPISVIPANMHKCISLAVTVSSFQMGMAQATGSETPQTVNSSLTLEIKNIENCVLHPERLFK